MNEKSYALRAGLFVVFFGLVMVAAIVWIGGNRKPTRPYDVVTKESVFGLKTASTVYFRGIAAGRVQDIGLDPRDPHKILIRLAIDENVPITRGTYAELKLHGFTGLADLELNATKDRRPLPTTATHPGRIPMRPSLLDELGQNGQHTLAAMTRLADRLNALLSAKNRQDIHMLLANAAKASGQFAAISDNLAAASRALPPLERSGTEAAQRLNVVAARLARLSTRLNTLVTTAQTAGNTVLARTLPRIDTTLDALRQTAADVSALSRSLRHDPQQLLLGAPPARPGPGEPGYEGR